MHLLRTTSGRYSSDPQGHIRFLVRQPDFLQRYRFDAQTVDFILCSHCGCYLGALQEGRLACANVNVWLQPGEAVPIDFADEPADQRRKRRESHWSLADVIDCQALLPTADHPLLKAYFVELASLLGGFDPTLGPSAHPEEMSPPRGVFLVLSEKGQPLAGGGLKTHAPGVGEIKRMYIVPEARGRGLGRDLLLELERHALLLGMTRIVLDTAAPLHTAHTLYLTSGYREVERFNDKPYAERWFAKQPESEAGGG